MQTKKCLLIIAVSTTMFGCINASTSTSKNDYSTADSTAVDDISSSAAIEKTSDSSQMFIPTADLRFKVKDVTGTTYRIEDIVGRERGFVTRTNLQSDIDSKVSVPVSEDSTLETTCYTIHDDMTIRVPNSCLDTTLKQIAGEVYFLDSRTIKADDVSLHVLANDLTKKRAVKTAIRMSHAIDVRGLKLPETTTAEEILSDKEEQSDNAALSNRSLKEQVNYSTITLSLYQRQTCKDEMIANDKNIEAYKAGLGKQLKEAFVTGWEVLESFFIFLMRCWGIFVLVAAAYVMYKAWSVRKKSTQ